jgi:hypothetical protein
LKKLLNHKLTLRYHSKAQTWSMHLKDRTTNLKDPEGDLNDIKSKTTKIINAAIVIHKKLINLLTKNSESLMIRLNLVKVPRDNQNKISERGIVKN